MLRRQFLQGAAAASLMLSEKAGAGFGIFQVNGGGGGGGTTGGQQNVPIGGIGLTRGMTMANDGTLLTWNDSVGPYKTTTALTPGSNSAPFTPWTQIMRGGTVGGSGGTNFPSSWLQSPTPYLGQGCVEIATVANNSNFMMAMICGISGHPATNLFKSTDGGTTWTLTNFPANSLGSNGSAPGTYSQSICIDPNNNLNAWVTGDSNVEVTLDGGTTWNTCASLPTAQCFAMAFDPTTPNRLIVGSLGNGLYVSTNANLGTSATFTHIASSITNPAEGRFGSDGVYYCTNGATQGGLYRVIGTTFVQITTASGSYSVAIDPNNPARVATWSSGNSSLGGQGVLVMNASGSPANTGSPTFIGPLDKSMSSTPDAPHVGNSFNNVNGSGPNGNTTMTNGNGLWFDPWTTTSTSTVTVGLGSKTFNVPDGIPNITVGRTLRASVVGTLSTYVIGTVASYISLGGGRANLVLTVGVSTTATISIASPAVVTMANTFQAGQQIFFATTGALPTGITAGTTYFVISSGLSSSSFSFSATSGGAAVNTTGTQSGVQSVVLTSGTYLGAPTGGSGSQSNWIISAERVYMNSGPGGGPVYLDGLMAGVQAVGSCTFGLEGSSVYDIIWPVGGNPVFVTQDRGIFPVPRNPWNATAGVVDCWGFGAYNGLFQATTLAVHPSNPAFFVTGGFSSFMKTTTGPNNNKWSATATQPGGNTGVVACANTNIFVSSGGPSSSSQGIFYTQDGGTTWTIMPAPAPVSSWTWQAPFITSHSLDLDTTTTGPFVFYAFNISAGFLYQMSVPAVGTPIVTQKANILPFINTSQVPGAGLTLKCVPGHAGHIFFSAGEVDSSTTVAQVYANHPNGASVTGNFTLLQFSSNSGGTFTTLSTTQEVITFGLGAPSTDAGTSGYPTIFAVGWCGGGQYGLYKCINFNPASLGSETWTLLSNYIGTYGIGPPVCVAGDPNQEGRCIVGINGNGAAIFQEAGKTNGWF